MTAQAEPRPSWWGKRWSTLDDDQKRQKVARQRKDPHMARFTVAELWRYQDLDDAAEGAAREMTIAQRNFEDAADYLVEQRDIGAESRDRLAEYGAEIEAAATARAST